MQAIVASFFSKGHHQQTPDNLVAGLIGERENSKHFSWKLNDFNFGKYLNGLK